MKFLLSTNFALTDVFIGRSVSKTIGLSKESLAH
jgi:hypothetical protein